jgi:hypothetical protein
MDVPMTEPRAWGCGLSAISFNLSGSLAALCGALDFSAGSACELCCNCVVATGKGQVNRIQQEINDEMEDLDNRATGELQRLQCYYDKRKRQLS